MNKLLLFFFLLTVTLVAILIMSASEMRVLRTDNSRLSRNLIETSVDVDSFRTISGRSAARSQELELTLAEAVKMNEINMALIDDLNLKLRRLKSISTTSATTKVNISPVVRDIEIIIDSVIVDTCKTFNFADEWVTVNGIVCDRADLYIEHRDTISTVVHRVPWKFLFFRFGTKELRQDVISSSPYSSIVYSKTIKLK